MPALARKRDLVEEFWDASTVGCCRADAVPQVIEEFLDDLRTFLGASGPMWPAASGRAALREILALCVSRFKCSVLLCGFNCRVVADAALSAGCRVDTFDLADTTGRIDWHNVADQLSANHAAIVIPHLFGVPTDFRAILAAAERAHVLVIEDCAHTLGAAIDGSAAGTLGDAAIFSFNHDKPISLGGGGAVLVNNPELVRRFVPRIQKVGVEQDERELRVFLQYLRRRRGCDEGSRSGLAIAWPLRKLSRSIGTLRSTLEGSGLRSPFRASGIGPLRAALGRWQLQRYPEILRRRNANAMYFALMTNRSWHMGAGITAAWLKQKAIPSRAEDSGRISEILRRRGLPVGTVNWSTTIDRYVGSTPSPVARAVAAHGLDVPVHQNVERSELDLICRAFTGQLSSPRSR